MGEKRYFCSMKLEKLKISNFRCFRQFEISFASDVTVLIGKNGAGKSTLIDAIHKALSFAFMSDKNYDGFLLADGIKSLKPENFSEEQDFLLDPETGYPGDGGQVPVPVLKINMLRKIA